MNKTPTLGPVSELLEKWNSGEPTAWDDLVPVIYDELRDQARRLLRGERSAHTLQTTDLVHEAYIKLAGQRVIEWENRAHFFWLASEIMRRILVDYARRRKRNKRGGDAEIFPLNSDFQIAIDNSGMDVEGLDASFLESAITALTETRPLGRSQGYLQIVPASSIVPIVIPVAIRGSRLPAGSGSRINCDREVSPRFAGFSDP
ncbi:MAG: ECF-type sigma factor [Pyrinomonadaceae bacterium]